MRTEEKLNKRRRYLEPYLEIERGAGVTSSVEESEGDAAVDAATDKDGDLQASPGHRARQEGLMKDE